MTIKDIKEIKAKLELQSFILLFLAGIMCVILGMGFNDVAEVKGRMPVYSDTVKVNSDTHYSIDSLNDVAKPFFIDRYTINRTVYSIGDFIMYLGGILLGILVYRLPNVFI